MVPDESGSALISIGTEVNKKGKYMGEIFDYVDELGPTKIMHVYEPRSELKGVLVIDNVAAGPSIGGLRMAPDVSTRRPREIP